MSSSSRAASVSLQMRSRGSAARSARALRSSLHAMTGDSIGMISGDLLVNAILDSLRTPRFSWTFLNPYTVRTRILWQPRSGVLPSGGSRLGKLWPSSQARRVRQASLGELVELGVLIGNLRQKYRVMLVGTAL
jgi:hypothetical protein